MEDRKRVPNHELKAATNRLPVGYRDEVQAPDQDRLRLRLRNQKVEGQSRVSRWAPSKMGVTRWNLGTLSGPHGEMTLKAPMEMWSNSRTPPFSLSLNGPTAQKDDPRAGRCAIDQLGYWKSRARSPDLEGSGKLRLDIESRGIWPRSRASPTSSGSAEPAQSYTIEPCGR